jgi:hypothetical protein
MPVAEHYDSALTNYPRRHFAGSARVALRRTSVIIGGLASAIEPALGDAESAGSAWLSALLLRSMGYASI